MMSAINEQGDGCRLCNGPLSRRFGLKVLGEYDVEYFECSDCGSLQTECPYWLDEAYRNANLSNLDTGAVQRNIQNMTVCFVASKLFNLKNVIDMGGGDGLLCRMLRDREINCYVKDKYATPTYAQGFTEENFDKPDMLLGFELLEHLAHPKTEIEDLFKSHAKALLFSTEIYSRQDKSWWYLSPEAGQHVFFYSNKALNRIAEQYGYALLKSGSYILFLKDVSPVRRLVARIFFNRYFCHLFKAVIVMLPARGVWKDHVNQRDRLK